MSDTRAGEPDASDEKARRRAENIVVHRLAARARSRHELYEALQRKQIPDTIIEETLTEAENAGLIDDRAFACAWAHSRRTYHGQSTRAIRYELARKGVPADIIDDTVADITEESEEETARDLVAAKIKSTEGLPPDVRARRLVAMLARKGYPPDLAYRVVRQAVPRDAAERFRQEP